MWQLGVAIVAVIVINGSFSFWQEYRAERAIAALRKLLPQHGQGHARRHSCRRSPPKLLVPGRRRPARGGRQRACRLPADSRRPASASTPRPLPASRCPRRAAPRPSPARLAARHEEPAAGRDLAGFRAGAAPSSSPPGMRTEFGKIAHLTQSAAKMPSHLQLEIARLSKTGRDLRGALGSCFFAHRHA